MRLLGRGGTHAAEYNLAACQAHFWRQIILNKPHFHNFGLINITNAYVSQPMLLNESPVLHVKQSKITQQFSQPFSQ